MHLDVDDVPDERHVAHGQDKQEERRRDSVPAGDGEEKHQEHLHRRLDGKDHHSLDLCFRLSERFVAAPNHFLATIESHFFLAFMRYSPPRHVRMSLLVLPQRFVDGPRQRFPASEKHGCDQDGLADDARRHHSDGQAGAMSS